MKSIHIVLLIFLSQIMVVALVTQKVKGAGLDPSLNNDGFSFLSKDYSCDFLLLDEFSYQAGEETIYIDCNTTLTKNISVHSDIHLIWEKGNVVNFNGNTLSFNTQLDAGSYQIFNSARGEDNINFSEGLKVKSSWWGANNLDLAINDVGNEKITLVIDRGITLNEPITIPKSLCIEFIPGNIITTSGHSVTINGKLVANPTYQLFSSSAYIAWGYGSIFSVRPEWWGAIGDNNPATAKKNTIAIQAAIDSLGVVLHNEKQEYKGHIYPWLQGGVVEFGKGAYHVLETIHIKGNFIRLKGQGSSATSIHSTADGPIIEINPGGSPSYSSGHLLHGISIEKMTLRGDNLRNGEGKVTAGIKITGLYFRDPYIEDIVIQAAGKYGIYTDDFSNGVVINRCLVEGDADDSAKGKVYGLYLKDSNNIQVTNTYIRRLGDNAITTGIYMENCDTASIRNVTIEHVGTVLEINGHGPGGTIINGLYAEKARFNGISPYSAIKIDSSSSSLNLMPKNIEISNSRISWGNNIGADVILFDLGWCENIIIKSSHFVASASGGGSEYHFRTTPNTRHVMLHDTALLQGPLSFYPNSNEDAIIYPEKQSIWVPANTFIASLGSPALKIIHPRKSDSEPYQAWILNEGEQSGLTAMVPVPRNWGRNDRLQIQLHYTSPNPNKNSTFKINLYLTTLSPGSSLAARPSSAYTCDIREPATSYEYCQYSPPKTWDMAKNKNVVKLIIKRHISGDTSEDDFHLLGFELIRVKSQYMYKRRGVIKSEY